MSSNPDSHYRWVILVVCWAAFTMTSVDRSTWGPAAAAVSNSLGVPLATLGIFATGYYLGYVLSNAGGGVLIDWLGGRAVLTCSGLGAGLFMVLFGSANSVSAGVAFQGVVGLFAGVDFAAGIKLITRWFVPERRGFAFGVFMTATSLGTVIANAIVPRLIRISGWQTSYHVFGGMTILIALMCLLLIRDGASGEVTGYRLADLGALRRNRDLALLGLAGFGGLWGTYGFITWSNTLMTKGMGIDPVSAGVILVIFASIAIGVKPVVGWVCDRLGLGLRVPIVATLVFFGATLLVFGSRSSYTQFLWVAPLLGIGAYAYSPLTAAMTPILTGHRVAGSAAGAINAFWQLGSVTVPAVIGPVFVATGSFAAAFAALAAGPLFGAVAMLFVRERLARTSPPWLLDSPRHPHI